MHDLAQSENAFELGGITMRLKPEVEESGGPRIDVGHVINLSIPTLEQLTVRCYDRNVNGREMNHPK